MIQVFSFVMFLLLLLYGTLFMYFRRGWLSLSEEKTKKDYIPKTFVSIIVPARNEAQNIQKLINDILEQIYPSDLMEIIIVDDHSTDDTAKIIQSFKEVRYISLNDFIGNQVLNAYKKKAIEVGIKQAKGTLIITTDADCRLDKFWLLSVAQHYETKREKLIASPVVFEDSSNWFQIFQSIDFFTMQGITGALSFFNSGSMCNGANLAYTKTVFETVKGFEGIDNVASGDDMLLMYKIEQHYPQQTTYLKNKNAIVTTQGMKTFLSFFQQRIRWASKSKQFKDKNLIFILSFIFFFNFTFILLGFLSIFNSQFIHLLWSSFIVKIGIELLLLIPVSRFFNKSKELIYFIPLQIIHIPYIVISAILSLFVKYQWKERTVQ